MIKNLVFDLGQVVFSYKRKYMVEKFVTAPEDSALLQEVVFDRLYWDRLDEGTLSDGDALTLMKARLPKRLWSDAESIYNNWIYNIPVIDETIALVREMKERFGVRTFVLSNIPQSFVKHKEEFAFLKEFEKHVFSSDCGFTKPNPKIYEHLCRECGIRPEETLFIDDRQINVDAAEAFGIKSYRFTGADGLREYLINLFTERN